MTEKIYRMDGKLVRESEMQEWHNSRGLPWGEEYRGPDPITICRMVPVSKMSLGVHLANEHGVDHRKALRGTEVEHMHAHMTGTFRKNQSHYHQEG